jgi:hypothetical protein
MELTIQNIILSMREFQKKNCIKKQCISNSQYLYDCIKINYCNINVKVKAVLALSINSETETFVFVGGHLVIVLDNDSVIDPSYDIFCLKDISYFDNIKDLMDMFGNDKNKLNTKIDLKKIIYNHIHFKKIADRMNNGECLVSEKAFYNEQADYIEKLYLKM